MLQKLRHLYELVLSHINISKIYVGVPGIAAKVVFFRLELYLVTFSFGARKGHLFDTYSTVLHEYIILGSKWDDKMYDI